MVKVLVTGGAGFIGSNFVRYALRDASRLARHDARQADLLRAASRTCTTSWTTRGTRSCTATSPTAPSARRWSEARTSWCTSPPRPTWTARCRAPATFIHTDVFGTFVLLEAARQATGLRRFIQISTDEVYGSVPTGASKETDELRPRNPYSASKAGADRLAYSYWATYQVPVVVTRASNNYGPYQFPEKVIPLFITNALEDLDLPLYGDGMNVRDWLHVDDHCRAVDLVIEAGVDGEVYNIGGGNEVPNIELTRRILQLIGKPDSLIRPVADRLGHDRRYALDTAKLRALGWAPRHAFADGLAATVEWYQANPWWWRPIKHEDPAYQAYYKAQYATRSGA